MTYRIVAFAGSNSTQSINKRLVAHAADVLNDSVSGGVDTDLLDLNDYEMPIYSPERQAAGIPPQAQAFFDKIGNADALLISLAEYNGSYATAFKNIFDWCSRIDMAMFQKKPVLVMATSPGLSGGQHVHGAAMGAFPFYGADVVAGFQFGPFGEHFDVEAGCLTSDDKVAELQAAVEVLKAALDGKRTT
ncbi:NAD(P)H-dependent oxidoreductase [Roseovarius aestuarii]|nr:NAD(P)H-dependent oxidoreductase [Roseovarius aestuarii]